MSDKDLVTVSALVLLDQDKRILISERPNGKFMQGFWEFPGGKLEKGENTIEMIFEPNSYTIGNVIIKFSNYLLLLLIILFCTYEFRKKYK